MDEKLKERVINDLMRYEERVKETDEHYDELGFRGRYAPDAPYWSKYLLPCRIRVLEDEGVDCEAFYAEYARITRKLTALEEKRGHDYREKLLGVLHREVNSTYPRIVCFFADLEPFELEIPYDTSLRNGIEILLRELERDFDLTEIKTNVAILDEVFRCKYLREVETVLKYFPEAEDLHYPDEFWWMHPLTMLREKQAIAGEMYGDESRFTHYEDHRQEWSPVPGQKAYQQKAVTLINRRDKGVELFYQMGYDALIVYDRNANEVACGTQDGLIATHFRPRTQPTHEIDDEIAGRLTRLN